MISSVKVVFIGSESNWVKGKWSCLRLRLKKQQCRLQHQKIREVAETLRESVQPTISQNKICWCCWEERECNIAVLKKVAIV